ncbi:MAG: hypothetical protein H6Q14_2556 [Bacteroidetes bacterium]|nr:hypothetical protein [Bacteroidota bacterium]
MDREINEDIAIFFLSDSREYLKRYEHLKEFQTEISNRSKLLIDIVFSFECSLKALIFIESLTNESETYKKVRKCGHDLSKLINEVDTEYISGIKSKIDDNIEHFSISSRYTLEANIYFRNSVGALDDLYYSTIADFIWLDDLYLKAKDLLSYVDSKIDRSLKSFDFGEIDLERELEKTKRLKQLGGK